MKPRFEAALLLGCLTLAGCRGTEPQDRADLGALRLDILRVIGTPSCADSADCAVIAVGSKPCGGPWEYLIYSRAGTDTTALFDRVRNYNALQESLNKKWGWVSDCSLAHKPRAGCRNGVCVDLDRP